MPTTWSSAYGSFSSRLYLEAKQKSQNVNNNTSVVTVRVYLAGTASSADWSGYPAQLHVKANNNQIAHQTGITYDFRGSNKSKQLWTGDITVQHNANGTGSAKLWAKLEEDAHSDPYGISRATVTGTLTLDTIITDRPLELSKTSFNLGETITIYPNVIANEDMDLYLDLGNNRTKTIKNMATTAFDWVVHNSLSQYFGSSQSITGQVVGNKHLNNFGSGTERVSVQVNIPSDFGTDPTVNALAMSELNSLVSQNFSGTWVERRSKIEFLTTVQTHYGATLAEATLHLKLGTQSTTTHAMSVSGQQVSISRDNLSAGSYQAWVTAKDNRGYTGQSAVVTFSVVAYEPPKINSVSASRDPNDNTKINIKANASNHHLSNRNSLFVRLLLQQGGDWLQIGGTQTTKSGAIEYNHTATDADELFSFNFRIEVNDLLTAPFVSEFNVGSGTAYPPINTFEDRALAAGVIYDEDLGGNIQTSNDGMAIGRTRITSTGTTLTNLEMEDNDIKYNGTSLLSGGSTISGDVLQVVNHGANGSISRPEGAVAVYWIGSVEPLNATDNDIWVR